MVTPAQDLARRVDEVTGQASPGRSLRRGSLRFLRTAALPVGIQGPTAGVIIGPAIIAGLVGEPGALAQILALVAMGSIQEWRPEGGGGLARTRRHHC